MIVAEPNKITLDELNRILNDLKKHYGGSLEENQTSLKDIVHSLADIVEAVADAKIKIISWKYHQQTLIGKIIFTSHSIITLSSGFDYAFYKRPDKARLTDYSSLYILSRALIENYLTLCYIYHNKLSDEERLFRYKLWEVSGLISRQNFESSTSREFAEKKEKESISIEKIIKEIEVMPEYQNLNRRKLDNLFEHGLPRLESWHKMIENSNLKKPFFTNLYSLFSSYTHSEYLSILQLSQASLNSKSVGNISNVEVSLSVVRIINCLAIEFYVKNFKSAEIIFNTFPDKIRNAVKIWQGVGQSSTGA